MSLFYDPEAYKKGVLLAETLEKVKPIPDPTGWWISEKLDGVRAYWNGQNFYSRNGLMFDAPDWFKADLPKDVHLDGELWCGREQFERCVGIIKYHKGSTAEAWKDLLFLCFDAPVIKGNDSIPYEARNEALMKLVGSCKYAATVGIRKCTGKPDLDEKLKAVLMHGGEGLMLRKPGSLYERRRSKSLLKVKTFLDAEAKIVGHNEGKGKHQGMLGALSCEMPLSSIRFEVGTGFTDADRNWLGAKKRWPVGSVVTYKYQNLTVKGVPRFPVFLRARTDKTWAEVEADAKKDADDKMGAGGVPTLVRAPSLMMRPTAGQAAPTSAAAAAAAAAGPSSSASSSSAAPPPLVKRASSLLFTEDKKVDAAAANAGPPSKKPKTDAGVDAAVESEPKLTRSSSEVSAAAPPAPKKAKHMWLSPAERAALAAKMREAIKEGQLDRFKIRVGGTLGALRDAQVRELKKWAELRKYDRNYLHVAKDGVPNHFEAMDGSEMRIFCE